MRLILLLPFLAVGMVGCANLSSGIDQIFGRTKVTPPATGSAAAADPAYTNRGLASTAAPLATTVAPAPAYSSIPAVAKAPEAVAPRPQTAAAVPLYNSSVPLNVAPSVATTNNPVTANPVAVNPVTVNPVAVSNTTTYNGSSSGSLDSNPYGPGPKMTRTRVNPMSLSDSSNNQSSSITPIDAAPTTANALADNRSRTYGQLGQVTVDRNGASLGTNAAASTAAVGAIPSGSTMQSGNWSAPNSSGQSNSVIDIMDLPPKGSGSASGSGSSYQRPGSAFGAATTIHRDAAVQQASATMVETSPDANAANPYAKHVPEVNKPISRSDTAKYGCAADHSWLKGRLEYSQSRRCWKLRYIPIDGTADNFGGSVVLQNTSLLSGYERGDYVEVKGRLSGESKTPGDFAPDYEIVQIKRVDR